LSAYYNILNEIKNQISQRINTRGEDGYASITDKKIVLRHQPFVDGMSSWDNGEETPGVVISPIQQVNIPVDSGDLHNDDVQYGAIIQIIDKCNTRLSDKQLKSWTKWEENIRSYFSHNDLRLEQYDSTGYCNQVLIPSMEWADSRQVRRHKNCIFLIPLIAVTRIARNENGRA